MNSKEKILKYIELENKLQDLDNKKTKLVNERDNLFFEKANRNGIYLNTSAVVNYFINYPNEKVGSWYLKRDIEQGRGGMIWSKESLDRSWSKVLKILRESKYLTLREKYFYTLNPVIKPIIKEHLTPKETK